MWTGEGYHGLTADHKLGATAMLRDGTDPIQDMVDSLDLSGHQDAVQPQLPTTEASRRLGCLDLGVVDAYDMSRTTPHQGAEAGPQD